MEIIKLDNISKTYGKDEYKTIALHNINLTVNKGEFLGVMGTSGSGKSTLLNIMGCIDTQTEGIYYINGKQVNKLSDKDLSRIRNNIISFVFQHFALINEYNVYDNIELPLKFRKISSNKKKEIVMKYAKRLGIENQINKKPTHLSGGQQQRVAIARALCSEADIILADEPTGALDKNTGEELLELLREINNEGKTIILVTHDLKMVKYCTRIINIEDGKIVKEYNN